MSTVTEVAAAFLATQDTVSRGNAVSRAWKRALESELKLSSRQPFDNAAYSLPDDHEPTLSPDQSEHTERSIAASDVSYTDWLPQSSHSASCGAISDPTPVMGPLLETASIGIGLPNSVSFATWMARRGVLVTSVATRAASDACVTEWNALVMEKVDSRELWLRNFRHDRAGAQRFVEQLRQSFGEHITFTSIYFNGQKLQ